MAWATACLCALAAFAPAVVLLDKPVTAVVPVPEKARQAKIVLLQLEGVLVRRDAPAVWNVFWNLPSADTKTSVDNIHFAGYVSSLPNSAAPSVRPANFTLELPRAAVQALHSQESMRFTFVPTRKLPAGGVTITVLRLE